MAMGNMFTADAGSAPALRADVELRLYGDEAVVASEGAAVFLDPVSAVVAQIIDGEATVAELAADVNDVLGVDVGVATERISSTVAALGANAMLAGTSSVPVDLLDRYCQPPSP